MKRIILIMLFFILPNLLIAQHQVYDFYNNNIHTAIKKLIELVESSSSLKEVDKNDSLYAYYIVYIYSFDNDFLNIDYNIVNLSERTNLADIYEKIYYQDNIGDRKVFIAFANNDDTALINKFSFLEKVSPFDDIYILSHQKKESGDIIIIGSFFMKEQRGFRL